jgi:hypothetical protein
VSAGLVSRAEDWRGSSYNESAGMSANRQNKRWGSIIDCGKMPSGLRAQI